MKIIKFLASYCSPCHMYSPIFNEVKELYKQHEFVSKSIETDDYTGYTITSVPTTIIEKDWKVVATKKWFMDKNDLVSFINSNEH